MGFYELGNGCDSCDIIPSSHDNVNKAQQDMYSPNMSASGYGTQVLQMAKQYNNIVSAGYAQGNNMGSMGNGSNGSTLGSTTMTTTVPATTIVQTIPVQQTQQKQVAAPGPGLVMVSTNQKQNHIEGFTSNMNSSISGSTMSDDKRWMLLGLVVFCALASNECCKYFLNKSLQLNDGSPMYYFAYAVVAIL